MSDGIDDGVDAEEPCKADVDEEAFPCCWWCGDVCVELRPYGDSGEKLCEKCHPWWKGDE